MTASNTAALPATATNFLLFRFAGQTLALDAGLVRQVVPIEHVFALPGVSGGLLGLIPAAGRTLPLVDLAGLAKIGLAPQPGHSEAGHSEAGQLGLLCEVAGDQFALPAEQVIGFVQEDEAPQTTELLSAEVLLGGYSGGGQRGQVLNVHTLLALLQDRLLPI